MVIARFFPAIGASLIVLLVAATAPLGGLARGVGIAFAFASWLATFVFERREVRAHASVVAAIVAVIAAGQTRAGVVYDIAAGIFLVACLVSMRKARATATVPPRLGRTGALFAIAGVVTTGFLLVLPPLAWKVERRIGAMMERDYSEQTAFSTTMQLGSTRGMLQSDTVVLRIDGPQPSYLRGAVYDHFDGMFWRTSGVGRKRFKTPASSTKGDTTITLVPDAPNGEDMRWFTPGNACDVDTEPGTVDVDGYGVFRRGGGKEPRTFKFRTTDCDLAPRLPAPPGRVDLEVAGPVTQLRPIAEEWTKGATTDREKLDAIARHLGRFEYSLSVQRDEKLDPIVDFVTVHQAGHCEMFASALAILGRMRGVPTRVVGGYRVREFSTLTNRGIVRERDAHAWVEAWVDGAWHAWDPTPPSDAPGEKASTWEHVVDAVVVVRDRIVLFLTTLSVPVAIGILGGFLALLVLYREVSRRVRSRTKAAKAGEDRPLPAFATLVSALEGAGHRRDESEPIEAFARRLSKIDAKWSKDVANAITAYAALRYGGRGEELVVTRELERLATSTRK